MKKILLFTVFLLTTLFSYGQSYLGTITKQVNFRQGPSTGSAIISSLLPGTTIFIVSLEADNDFYNVIDVATNKEGYVHKSFVRVGEVVQENESGMFVQSGESTGNNPEVEVFNNTTRNLTLKLNSTTYTFRPFQKKTITLTGGYCNYRASAPGVIPNIGSEYVETGTRYSWEFYIVTR